MGPVSSINLRFLASPSSCATPRKKGYRKTRRSYWAIWYACISHVHIPFVRSPTAMSLLSSSLLLCFQVPCPHPLHEVVKDHVPSLLQVEQEDNASFCASFLASFCHNLPSESEMKASSIRYLLFYHPLPVIQSPCAMMCIWQNIWRIFYIKKNW